MGKPKITRAGPVHFQPLEWELAPVARYFSGDLLNAGCGNRDLTSWFASCSVAEFTSYDIATDAEGAVTGSLEAMPFPDGRFDTILCNAVLEHVENVDAVMKELARVLKRGGYAVIAVPFLQPYHPCPGDYRRYTKDGLIALGASVGLDLVQALPVHSAAQSVGWILWETAVERGRLARAVAWPIVYVWTRLSLRTDLRIARNANTYQIVFRRP
jgi:SAM-dependent methyltransferase